MQFIDEYGLAFVIAISFTFIFLLYFTATVMFGIFDDIADNIFDFDSGSSGFYLLSFLTISGILGGVAIGGWSYIYFQSFTDNPLLYSFLSGFASAFALGLFRKAVTSMATSEPTPPFSVNIGDTGSVYLDVQPKGINGGQAFFIDKYHRKRAVNVITNSPDKIEAGKNIQVVDISGNESHKIITVVELGGNNQ